MMTAMQRTMKVLLTGAALAALLAAAAPAAAQDSGNLQGTLGVAVPAAPAGAMPPQPDALTPPSPDGAPAREPTAADLAADPLLDVQLRIGIQESFARRLKLSTPQTRPEEMGSVLFSPWQHALLQEAKKGFRARRAAPGELTEDINAPREKGIREISLGGIVYAAPEEWTVWLNGQRLTPDALPEEIIDIKVMEDFVQLKWFDSYTNLIFPVRLRAHQRFNLDTRIFLPGTGAL